MISDWLPDLSDPGWRELVFALVVLLLLYALVMALRIVRLHRRGASAPVPPFEPFRQAAIQPYLREQGSLAVVGDEIDERADKRADKRADERADEQPPRHARAAAPIHSPPNSADIAWERAPADFAERQVRLGLEREVEALREELDALRGAFASLRDEVRQEVSGIKAQQSVSPFYRDAMQMALSGAAAETIAERCGIARGEADLVVALVRGNDGIDDQLGLEGGNHGGRPQD